MMLELTRATDGRTFCLSAATISHLQMVADKTVISVAGSLLEVKESYSDVRRMMGLALGKSYRINPETNRIQETTFEMGK